MLCYVWESMINNMVNRHEGWLSDLFPFIDSGQLELGSNFNIEMDDGKEIDGKLIDSSLS